jgi:hypothetical protein
MHNMIPTDPSGSVSVAEADVDVDDLFFVEVVEVGDDCLYGFKSSISQDDLKINKQFTIDGVLASLCFAKKATQLVCSGHDEGSGCSLDALIRALDQRSTVSSHKEAVEEAIELPKIVHNLVKSMGALILLRSVGGLIGRGATAPNRRGTTATGGRSTTGLVALLEDFEDVSMSTHGWGLPAEKSDL